MVAVHKLRKEIQVVVIGLMIIGVERTAYTGTAITIVNIVSH